MVPGYNNDGTCTSPFMIPYVLIVSDAISKILHISGQQDDLPESVKCRSFFCNEIVSDRLDLETLKQPHVGPCGSTISNIIFCRT